MMDSVTHSGGHATTESKWVVTGVNRMTKERQPVSRAYDKATALKLRDAMATSNHRASVWTRLKVEPACREADLRQ